MLPDRQEMCIRDRVPDIKDGKEREVERKLFPGYVQLHVRLGVDSRHADQQVRGAVVLPNLSLIHI